MAEALELSPNTSVWQAGQTLGPFRLIRELGRGGMGMVWLAEQLEPFQREVAIKVLKTGKQSVLAEAYFEVERQSLAQLSHRAIAQIYDAGRLPDGGLFFAMEYVHGIALDQYLQKCPLDDRDLAALLLEICAGVQHAHQRGLIHRDLKPQNIIVQEEDKLRRSKIIDFGIAIGLSQLESQDNARHLRAGTQAYMAPEQRDPEAGGIDVRTDVYALGAVLAESLLICQGLGTFQNRNVDSSKARTLFHAGLGRLSPLNASIENASGHQIPARTSRFAVELQAISLQAMAPEREDRYPSVSAMADDLRRFLEDKPVMALKGGRMYSAGCFLRRHALASAAVSLIALAILGGTGMMMYGLSTPGHKYTHVQSVSKASMQGALRREWQALAKKRNAAVALWRRSLRAGRKSPSPALHSLELAGQSCARAPWRWAFPIPLNVCVFMPRGT